MLDQADVDREVLVAAHEGLGAVQGVDEEKTRADGRGRAEGGGVLLGDDGNAGKSLGQAPRITASARRSASVTGLLSALRLVSNTPRQRGRISPEAASTMSASNSADGIQVAHGLRLLARVGAEVDQAHLAAVDRLLARVLEIHGYLGADHGLHLSHAPVVAVRMAHKHAGFEK